MSRSNGKVDVYQVGMAVCFDCESRFNVKVAEKVVIGCGEFEDETDY